MHLRPRSVSKMAFWGLLLLAVGCLNLGECSPVVDGVNVGAVEMVNGHVTVKNPGTFAFVVRLEKKVTEVKKDPLRLVITTSHCGGVIIRKNIILTAAHCIGDDEKKPIITAWAGIVHTKLQKGEGQEIKMKAYKKHEEHAKNNSNGVYQPNDIALIWLEKGFDLRNKLIKVATLPPRHFNATTRRGWVVGWGKNECGVVSPMLKRADMRIFSRNECSKYYDMTHISEKAFCSLNDNKKATSSLGDSGGPLVVRGMVAGIQSFAAPLDFINKEGKVVESCDPRRPIVSTNVAKYIDWIQKKIAEGPPKQAEGRHL